MAVREYEGEVREVSSVGAAFTRYGLVLTNNIILSLQKMFAK